MGTEIMTLSPSAPAGRGDRHRQVAPLGGRAAVRGAKYRPMMARIAGAHRSLVFEVVDFRGTTW
jgi:hypothetical protein